MLSFGNNRKIDTCIEAGDQLLEEERYADAMSRSRCAWDLLKEPRDRQEKAVKILGAMADCCFFAGDWNGCCDVIQHAFRCGADVGNPFLRLRMGQSLYELGDREEAANWLVPVYLAEGRAPFEDEEPKYLESFREKLQPPAGGWPDGW